MKKLKHIQISEPVWEQLKIFCSQEGYSIKGYVEKLIKNDLNEKVLEVQNRKESN
jgi:hypothetical protein